MNLPGKLVVKLLENCKIDTRFIFLVAVSIGIIITNYCTQYILCIDTKHESRLTGFQMIREKIYVYNFLIIKILLYAKKGWESLFWHIITNKIREFELKLNKLLSK